MLVIMSKKLISKTLIVLLSVVVLGALLGEEAWAAGSFGARPGVGTSAGVGGGAVGVGPGAPARGAAGAPVAAPRGYVHAGPGVGTSAGVGGGAVGAGPGAPARGAAGGVGR